MDFDRFAEELERNRAKADDAVEPWQSEIKAEDYFIRFFEGLVIYGKVRELEDDEDKMLYNLPHMKNVRFSQCYSKQAPNGEPGNTHVAAMVMKISEEQFEAAKKSGWPVDMRAVYTLMNYVKGGDA